MKKYFLILICFFLTSVAHGRIFNYKKQNFSAYLRGQYGLNKAQKTAFQPGFPTSGSTTVTFPDHDGVNQDYDAELGLGLNVGRLNTRLGLGLIYPQPVTSTAGKNAAGTALLSLSSQISSLVPRATFELALKQTDTFKAYVGVAAGYAITTIKNTVSLNAAGQAAFPTAAVDYTEEGTSYGLLGEVLAGLEFAAFDNVGFSLDAGYRYLNHSSFNATRGANTVGGVVTTGSTLRNVDGTTRTLDLSGYFVGGTFRIYFN
jgi:hypothetical protein